ncbi:MAG: RDD family protein [Solirubrobacteraceae bacterium]
MTADELSVIPREARPYQGTTAGLLTRSLAAVIDAVSVVALLVVTYLGVNGVRFLAHPVGFQFSDLSAILSVVAALAVLVVYLTVAWWVTGRTYGDHVMGIRVVSRRGTRVRLLPALVRAVLSAVFPLGLLWCAVSPSRRSVQDVVVRTAVLYDWRLRR